jgi:diguanylate cyclase (GGDEF)-like protein
MPAGGGAGFRTLLNSLQSASVASFGNVPPGPALRRRFVVDADGRWVVSVSRPAPRDLSSPDAVAGIAFLAWLVIGLLLFALVLVLARGREHALRMVDEKTGQLRHQALHDALTGLPNRALIMDRAEQLLTRARREGFEPAAMFIDLDGFKDVNDTLGHESGDELLRGVASRIAGVLRASDTVGRLGGDEFVVLVEGEPDQVAQRILELLREPFALRAADGPVSVTGSIGIASGLRDAAKDLLRDADGVRVAVDDFGTGYSSLAYLQQLPVDALKIDRAFVAGEHALAETLVQLARSLKLRSIAEGIEDEAQLEHLRAIGCDRGQGYLFAPPLDAPALERYLARAPAAIVSRA